MSARRWRFFIRPASATINAAARWASRDGYPEPDEGLLEVRTRTGRSVLVPPGFDPSALAAVVAVLERC
jgi:hypothetical protein